MTDSVYKTIELAGTSTKSIEDAVQTALTRAAQTVHGMRWFQITELRGHVEDSGKVDSWQIVFKVGFKLER